MKNKLVFLFAILAFACNDGSKYIIRGKITNAEGKYVYLDELKLSSRSNIDSIKIDKNGQFKFTGKVSIPTYFLLGLGEKNKNFITLLIDSAEHVDVYGDQSNFSRDYIVLGSEGSALVQELNMRLSKTKHQLDSINNLKIANTSSNQMTFWSGYGYSEQQKKWDENIEQIKQAQMKYSQEFVLSHPFSMANVLALYQKFDDENFVIQDLQSLIIAANALNSFFPQSEHVKALYANTTKLIQEERGARLQRFIQEQGENFPDIVLPNPEGKEIALSSLKGKFVLLQFWAGADKGSRIMNPTLVDLYKRFRSKGFEIYQVSVDVDRYDWINAIAEDKLSWINVCDEKGSRLAVMNYNVTELPSNFLIDKDGTIINKNVKGPVLTNLLEKAL